MCAVLCLQKKNCVTPGDLAKWDLIHVCVGAVLSDLSGSQTWKRAVHFYPASFLSNLHTESSFEKLWVQMWLVPIVTENEFILNTKVTITHASSHPHPPPCTPFPFVTGGRQPSEKTTAMRTAVCQPAFKWSPVCHQIALLLSLPCHLYRFTKKTETVLYKVLCICCWIQSWNIYHFLD